MSQSETAAEQYHRLQEREPNPPQGQELDSLFISGQIPVNEWNYYKKLEIRYMNVEKYGASFLEGMSLLPEMLTPE